MAEKKVEKMKMKTGKFASKERIKFVYDAIKTLDGNSLSELYNMTRKNTKCSSFIIEKRLKNAGLINHDGFIKDNEIKDIIIAAIINPSEIRNEQKITIVRPTAEPLD